jgi:hypothetical protein
MTSPWYTLILSRSIFGENFTGMYGIKNVAPDEDGGFNNSKN